MLKKVFILLLLIYIGSSYSAMATPEKTPNDTILYGRQGKEANLPPIKENPWRPNNQSNLLLKCVYRPGYLKIFLPQGVDFLRVSLYHEGQNWSGIITNDQPEIDIPIFTGECKVICWIDNKRKYTGKLIFN